ncbi:MAG: class I SAM-dependent methyltransferase [Saprospiraceae bacterium]|nr:class I SAM-dependent methyltransferase [Saprospiraceae bacterium]
MDKNYYKEYYHLERNHWWFKARGEIIVTHLQRVFKGKTPIKILNIGAATGRSSELLMQLGDVTSIEYDQDCYEFSRDVVKLSIQQGSILDLDFPDNTFDLVCAFDVIEHVEDDAKAVSEMRRVCKQGGVMCVTVPAFMFLWSEHDVVNHHFRRYTSAILRGLFERQNEVVFHSFFNFWLFFPIALFRLLAKILPLKKKTSEETASDFSVGKGGLINSLFYTIFKSENLFLSRFVSLPIGVSILSTWRKPF